MSLEKIDHNGEINLSDDLLKVPSDICMKDDHSDVTFIVENTKIPAHKTILSISSSYFQTLFSGGFAESKQDEIELRVPLDAFRVILKYIYTGCLSLVNLEISQIMEIYDLGEQYGFDALKKIILNHLVANLSLENYGSIMNAAHFYSLTDLQDACLTFMDRRSIKLLDHDTFEAMLLSTLYGLPKRDTLHPTATDIFKTVYKWSKINPGFDINEIISTLRWSQISVDDLLNTVLPSGILDEMSLLTFLKENREPNNMTCRTPCLEGNSDENFATAEQGASVIFGENRSALLSDKLTDYDFDKGVTFHPIHTDILYKTEAMGVFPFDIAMDTSIIVDLGKVVFINFITFLLVDSRSYSYYIDVSIDGKEYGRLFDHTNGYCRSWQYLYFPSRPVRFIELVGTLAVGTSLHQRSDVSVWKKTFDSFDVVLFQAMHKTSNYPELVNGIIKPTMNISNEENSTIVTKGLYGNNMLNLNANEFTCHEIGSEIIVQFNQPYYVDSLRILLGNSKRASNGCSFFISTSLDRTNWETAIDAREQKLSGWQEFDFPPRPTVFIRITGTGKSHFLCAYFECPRNPNKPTLKWSNQ